MIIFFSNYIYGNYAINKNNLLIKNTLSKDNFINVKIISPNFNLKYNLSDKELNERLNKLIRYSDPKKNKKTLFIWPEGTLSGAYFYELKKFKNTITKKLLEKS